MNKYTLLCWLIWPVIGWAQSSPTTRPTATPPISATVANYQGKPTIMLNNKPVTPIIYAMTDSPGGRWSWEEYPQRHLQQFTKAGFNLFMVSIWFQDLWQPDGRFDMEQVRRQMRGVLDVNPNAAVIIRLHINAPFWWNDAHPEECTRYADGPWLKDTTYWELRRYIEEDIRRLKIHSLASSGGKPRRPRNLSNSAKNCRPCPKATQ